MIKLFEGKNMDFSCIEVWFMPPMTDQCDKDFKKRACMFFTVCKVLSLILLLMCQFSGETPLLKNPPFILFQFCDIVQECINKILWLTFISCNKYF